MPIRISRSGFFTCNKKTLQDETDESGERRTMVERKVDWIRRNDQ